MLITDQELIEKIEAFLARTGMAPTRFGREAAREASFLATLRNGRSPSLARANRVVQFMEEYEAAVVHAGNDTASETAVSAGNAAGKFPSVHGEAA